jgi:hypothetical protein
MSGLGALIVAVLLLAALVPIALLGVVRFTAWAAPAAIRWERRHRTGFSMLVAGMYLLLAAGFVLHARSEHGLAVGGLDGFLDSALGSALGGGMFVAYALGFIAKALRNRDHLVNEAPRHRTL